MRTRVQPAGVMASRPRGGSGGRRERQVAPDVLRVRGVVVVRVPPRSAPDAPASRVLAPPTTRPLARPRPLEEHEAPTRLGHLPAMPRARRRDRAGSTRRGAPSRRRTARRAVPPRGPCTNVELEAALSRLARARRASPRTESSAVTRDRARPRAARASPRPGPDVEHPRGLRAPRCAASTPRHAAASTGSDIACPADASYVAASRSHQARMRSWSSLIGELRRARRPTGGGTRPRARRPRPSAENT